MQNCDTKNQLLQLINNNCSKLAMKALTQIHGGCCSFVTIGNLPKLLNSFHATSHFLYPPENISLWFSDVSRGYRKRSVA